MVAESYDIARETYLAILMDRGYQGPVIVGSPKGGMDIEEVAKNTPEHIHKVTLTFIRAKSDQHSNFSLHNQYIDHKQTGYESE